MIDPNNKPPTMKTNIKYITIALISAAAINGCKKPEDPITPPPPPNEEEVTRPPRR